MSDTDSRKVDLSEQDKEILANLRKDAQIKRGFPMAMIAAAISSYHVQRVPSMGTAGKFLAVLSASIAGNLAGTISYFPTARRRMLEELPDDSELRKMLEEEQDSSAKKSPPFTPHHVLQQNSKDKNELIQLPLEELQTLGESDQVFDSQSKVFDQHEESQPNQKISYEQLRMKSRNPNYIPQHIPKQEEYSTNDEFTSFEEQTEPHQSEPDQPKRFVRYNKYGDEILD